jgi:hypothetical protein
MIKYKIALLVILLIGNVTLLTIQIVGNNVKSKRITELENKLAPKVIENDRLIDSLEVELFNAQSINGRYELSVEYLYEVNPTAAKEFDEYFNNETE